MDENTKWLVGINQRFSVTEVGQDGSTRDVTGVARIFSLSLKARSAKEVVIKADVWLEASKIEDAYVGEVCRDGLPTIYLAD